MLNDIQKGIVQNEINIALRNSVKQAIAESIKKIALDTNDMTNELINEILNQVENDILNTITLRNFLEMNSNQCLEISLYDKNNNYITTAEKGKLFSYFKYNIINWYLDFDDSLYVIIDYKRKENE